MGERYKINGLKCDGLLLVKKKLPIERGVELNDKILFFFFLFCCAFRFGRLGFGRFGFCRSFLLGG